IRHTDAAIVRVMVFMYGFVCYRYRLLLLREGCTKSIISQRIYRFSGGSREGLEAYRHDRDGDGEKSCHQEDPPLDRNVICKMIQLAPHKPPRYEARQQLIDEYRNTKDVNPYQKDLDDELTPGSKDKNSLYPLCRNDHCNEV